MMPIGNDLQEPFIWFRILLTLHEWGIVSIYLGAWIGALSCRLLLWSPI
jgi:hypothetical protein